MLKMDISYSLVLSTQEMRLVVSALGGKLNENTVGEAIALQKKIVVEKFGLLNGMAAGAKKALDNIEGSAP